MNRPAIALLLAMASGAACSRSDDSDAAGDRPGRARRSTLQDDRDQYRLAELVEAARIEDAEGGAGALERLRQTWLHTRVRWEVGHAPAFCGESGPCAALPFDHRRLRSRLPQGWLPQLRLDADARAELKACCDAVAGQCVFDFEGTLARFDLGSDRPTSLAFDDIELGACRSARPGESWVRRSSRAKSTGATDPHVALSRTGPAEG
jgi:hypothetical protein